MIDLAALKSELEGDPLALGYGSGDVQDVDRLDADLLNEVRAAVQVDRNVPTNEVREAIVPADWLALTDAQQRGLIFLTAGEFVNPAVTNVRAAFFDAFAGKPTIALLQALETEDGSRAVQLFGVAVTPSYVADARRL